MTIAAILAEKGSDVISVTGDMPARDAVALLAERRIGALPVVERDRVAGIFSERDLVYALARDGAAALEQPVHALMSAPAITVAAEQSVIGALALMTQRRVRHLPVIEDMRLIGFVSIGDLVKYRIGRIEEEAEAMRTYIQQV